MRFITNKDDTGFAIWKLGDKGFDLIYARNNDGTDAMELWCDNITYDEIEEWEFDENERKNLDGEYYWSMLTESEAFLEMV